MCPIRPVPASMASAYFWRRALPRMLVRESIERRRMVKIETDEPSSKCRQNFAITCRRGRRSTVEHGGPWRLPKQLGRLACRTRIKDQNPPVRDRALAALDSAD